MNKPPNEQPTQDKKLKLPKVMVAGRLVTLYDPSIALKIIERIAEGELLKDICSPGTDMPARSTFYRWVVNNPPLAQAYNAARELSAQALEEDALGTAAMLKDPKVNKKLTGTQVRAYEVAMNQLRWSAQRRDPAKFAERTTQSTIVPIQINTTLNLGDKSTAGETSEVPNIYTLEAEVVQETPLQDPSTDTRPLHPDGRPEWTAKQLQGPHPMDKPLVEVSPPEFSPRGKRILRPRLPSTDTGT